jgi:hypothetical protein
MLLAGTSLIARAQDDQSARRNPHETLRRLTLDLAGREPTDEEFKDFDKDNSPQAYRKLVDRLASEKPEKTDKDQRALFLLEHQELANTERLTQQYDKFIRLSLANVQQGQSTYMGVGVEAPGDALRAQLKLPPGLGLVVNYVDPNGPSKDLIHQHDVMEKLDDQLLMNGEQFAALVHMHKQGESVVVSMIREARPTQITIKLGQKEVSSIDKEVEHAHEQALPQAATSWEWAVAPGKEGNTFLLQRAGPVTFDDGSTVAVFHQYPDQQYLTAFDRTQGKLLFTGPVGSEAQWEQVPDDVRKRVAAWRGMVAAPADKTQQTGPEVLDRLPYIRELYRAPQTQPAAEKK